MSLNDDENVIVMSADDSEIIRRELSFVADRLKTLEPAEMTRLEAAINECGRLRLVIDAGSFANPTDAEIERRERHLAEIINKQRVRCLCAYRVNEISSKMIKRLSRVHGQLQLTTSDLTLISGDLVEKSLASYDSIKKIVKDNLEAIILALVQSKAMTGLNIIETINLEFKVLLSPGAVYPLLNSLQRKGLLTSIREGKERRYEPAYESKLEIKRIVLDQIQARNLLNNYLRKKVETKDGCHPEDQFEETIQKSM